MSRKKKVHDDTFDPGATLCGHAPRPQRAHYLGGGLWVCFECFAKLLLGERCQIRGGSRVMKAVAPLRKKVQR